MTQKTKYERAKAVTLNILKWDAENTVFVRFDQAIETRPTIDPKTGEAKEIDVAIVTNLDDGKQYDLVLGVVCKRELDLHYPDHGYVGLKFEMTKNKVKGKRYHNFEIFELA